MTPDPQLGQVRHAFDSAFRRMCEAKTEADLVSELSNMLSHLYRLWELCRTRLTSPKFFAIVASTNDLRAARAAIWARSFDTHDLFVVASDENMYSGYYTARYGVLAWKPLSSLPVSSNPANYGQDSDYVSELESKPVLDTLRRAFDALAALA
jgi:hypothetical protein